MRRVDFDVADWESICITRDTESAGYVITITYKLTGADVIVRRERRVLSTQLAAARQTALANLDADILTRIRGAEGV